MSSIADDLRRELDRLATEGDALTRGLLVRAKVLPLEDFRDQAKTALKLGDARRKELGQPKPKGKIEDRVRKLLKVWVLDFDEQYERWYSEAQAVVRQVLPDRLADFCSLYRPDRRKALDVETYGVADFRQGLTVTRGAFNPEPAFDTANVAVTKLTQQIDMVRAARKILDSRLRDIRGVVQANLFDSELDAARELLKNGYLRAAGVVAGVVLERHLAGISTTHKVTIRKANPTVSHYNDGLKTAGVIDVARWRNIQHLADVRNICAHNTGREPTAVEVRDEIDGVDKVIKSIF